MKGLTTKYTPEETQALLLDVLKGFVKTCIHEAVQEAFQEYLEKNSITIANHEKNSSDWISAETAKDLLNIRSKSKLQQLRDNSEIEFSQSKGGRLIQYSRKSIIAYLEKNRVTIK